MLLNLKFGDHTENSFTLTDDSSIRLAYELPDRWKDIAFVQPSNSSSGLNKEEGSPTENIILLDVPFTPQAPNAEWENPIYQGACEEASVLMAMHWVMGDNVITKEEAKKEIKLLANFQRENYNFFYDTSAADTALFMKEYFNYNNFELRYDINSDDIKKELEKGNVAIVPINGRKLGNPFYTPPGPIAHMLVVVGYNSNTNEFITHDPGTIHGERIRFNEAILQAALQDYPTGHLEPITRQRSAMIVIKR